MTSVAKLESIVRPIIEQIGYCLEGIEFGAPDVVTVCLGKQCEGVARAITLEDCELVGRKFFVLRKLVSDYSLLADYRWQFSSPGVDLGD